MRAGSNPRPRPRPSLSAADDVLDAAGAEAAAPPRAGEAFGAVGVSGPAAAPVEGGVVDGVPVSLAPFRLPPRPPPTLRPPRPVLRASGGTGWLSAAKTSVEGRNRSAAFGTRNASFFL